MLPPLSTSMMMSTRRAGREGSGASVRHACSLGKISGMGAGPGSTSGSGVALSLVAGGALPRGVRPHTQPTDIDRHIHAHTNSRAASITHLPPSRLALYALNATSDQCHTACLTDTRGGQVTLRPERTFTARTASR